MTNQQHPITPPDELVDQWHVEAVKGFRTNGVYEQDIATQAAQWGADQELEACLKWMGSFCATWTCGRRPEDVLRTARRPKPSSLKEQALAVIENAAICDHLSPQDETILRLALETLPND